MTALPKAWLLTIAVETPHQVSIAFMVAASSHAPNKYQTSFSPLFPSSGVNKRAIPAKSIAQNATARIVAHFNPRNCRSPSRSESANSVVLKLNISNAARAVRIIIPKASPRLIFIFCSDTLKPVL